MKHYIYFIQSRDCDPVKIGYSTSPKERLQSLQVGNPYKLEIKIQLQFDSLEEVRNMERLFHKQGDLHHQRLEGEWFRIKIPLAVFINDAHQFMLKRILRRKQSKKERKAAKWK